MGFIYSKTSNPISPILIVPCVADYTVNAGAWASSVLTTGYFNHILYNSTAAINNSVTFNNIKTSPGTYTLRVMAQKQPEGAIVTVYVNGASVGTYDQYKVAPASANDLFTIPGIILTSSSSIEFKATSKHASSSGYTVSIYAFTLTKTA